MRSARSLWCAAVAGLLAVAAVVALAVTGRGDARENPAATGDTAATVDPAAVGRALDAHAAALLDRDRAAYAAGVDDAPAAAQFRATQLAAFDHTDGVPFAAFGLRYDRTVVDDAPIAAVRARLGPTAGIVRAELTYAYDGIDARPAQHTVYLTVVRRGSDWKLAGDTDLEAAGGTSWRGPWDFGPLVVARGATSLVLTHPRSGSATDVAAAQTLATGIATDVDAGVGAVNGVWGTAWPQRVAVVVAGTQAELDAVTGGGYGLDAVAAVAVAEPTTAVTAGPDDAAGQRIALSGAAVPTLSATGRAVLLRHELTHVATRSVTGPGTPTWVVEGFADHVGNLAGSQPVRTVAAELATAVAAVGPPVALPADDAFTPATDAAGGSGTSDAPADTGTVGSGTAATAGGAAAAYEQAWLAFTTIAQLGGAAAPAAFYRAVAAATLAGTDPAVAVDTALRQTVGLDTATFTARWRATIATELAP